MIRPETRVFAATKSNLAKGPSSLQFRVIEVMKEAANGERITISKILAGNKRTVGMGAPGAPTSEEDHSAVDDAVEFQRCSNHPKDAHP